MSNQKIVTESALSAIASPARKYYFTTEKGLSELNDFSKNWNEFYVSVCKIMKGDNENG